PVLLSRHPYDKQAALSNFGYAHPAWYAERGYLVVVQDCRGRYLSDGDFTPFLNESEDGYDTVEWAARLPGANGRVAMYGFSYGGATTMLAAKAAPPSLATICPGFTGSQYYDGWTYQAGALNLAFTVYWSTLLGLDSAKRADDAEGYAQLGAALGAASAWFNFLPIADYPVTADHAPYFRDWVEHSSYDEYWRRWSIDEAYEEIKVPAIHTGGLYDIFLSGTVKNFVGLSSASASVKSQPQKLLLGPWTHMPWAPVDVVGGEVSTNEVDDWQVSWLDHHLKGSDNGVLDHPVTVYLLGEGIRNFTAWPPVEARSVEYFMHSQGRANSKFGDGWLDREVPSDEPVDIFIYDPATPTPSLGGHSCCFESVTPMGPADQSIAEVSRMVLVYTTEPLVEDMLVVGDAFVTLYAASSAVDTDFTTRLCVVGPDGTSINIQEGIVRARYRDSLVDPSPIAPGEVYRYRIELGPVATRVPAGSAIRVDISSSDFPQWDRNFNTGGRIGFEGPLDAVTATQTVLHSGAFPSSLCLPVVPG
ncbi:MAG: CocE/NonD family hydrolase, partial [Actinomycetota bacterium]|nr:CocE/NonD family hydrolase [Actinomycetota bacterium]